jgi:hypothetical protein
METLVDFGIFAHFRGFWQYQHENRKLYYRYYRTAFSCYDTVFGNVTLYYERKIEKG